MLIDSQDKSLQPKKSRVKKPITESLYRQLSSDDKRAPETVLVSIHQRDVKPRKVKENDRVKLVTHEKKTRKEHPVNQNPIKSLQNHQPPRVQSRNWQQKGPLQSDDALFGKG
jgi:hypothetical protein